jgi:hypothetical protein
MARRKNTRQNQKDSRKRAALFAGRHRTCHRSSAEILVDETTPSKKLV